VNEYAFAFIVQARPCPTFGRPVHLRGSPHRLQPGTSPHALRIPPHDGHPALRELRSGGSRSALVCFRLSPSCPFRPLHTFHSSRPARNYPRFWIRRSSSERQRDFNPPDQRAAQRTLWPLLTSPAPSPTVTRAVVRYSGQSRRPLEVRHAFFSRTRRIYPHGVPNDHWASPSLAGLPTPHWPDIRFLYVKSEISSSAFFRSRLATDTLA